MWTSTIFLHRDFGVDTNQLIPKAHKIARHAIQSDTDPLSSRLGRISANYEALGQLRRYLASSCRFGCWPLGVWHCVCRTLGME
jgi:hypothetical protein